MADQKTDLLQGTLDLLALKTLHALGPTHGWGIARRISAGEGASIVAAAQVDGEVSEVLGVKPLMGHTIESGDCERGREPVVLSHGLWVGLFSAGLAGPWPALRLSRLDLQTTLKEGESSNLGAASPIALSEATMRLHRTSDFSIIVGKAHSPP